MMNDSLSMDDEYFEYLRQLDDIHTMRVLPVIIVFGVLMLVGIAGNTLVCYVFVEKFNTSTTKYFIVSLSVLDLLNCVVGVPIQILDLRYNYTGGSHMYCEPMLVLQYFTALSSGFILISISCDRFRKICRPHRRQLTPPYARYVICGCCCCGFVMSLPAINSPSIIETPRQNVTGVTCSMSLASRESLLPLLYNIWCFILFIISTALLSVIYFLIWRVVARQSRFSKENKNNVKGLSTQAENRQEMLSEASSTDMALLEGPKESTSGDQKKLKRVLKTGSRKTWMLFLVTVVFVLSFLPHLSLMAAEAAGIHLVNNLGGVQLQVFEFFIRSYFFNNVANPFVYGLVSTKFRKEVKSLLKN